LNDHEVIIFEELFQLLNFLLRAILFDPNPPRLTFLDFLAYLLSFIATKFQNPHFCCSFYE